MENTHTQSSTRDFWHLEEGDGGHEETHETGGAGLDVGCGALEDDGGGGDGGSDGLCGGGDGGDRGDGHDCDGGGGHGHGDGERHGGGGGGADGTDGGDHCDWDGRLYWGWAAAASGGHRAGVCDGGETGWADAYVDENGDADVDVACWDDEGGLLVEREDRAGSLTSSGAEERTTAALGSVTWAGSRAGGVWNEGGAVGESGAAVAGSANKTGELGSGTAVSQASLDGHSSRGLGQGEAGETSCGRRSGTSSVFPSCNRAGLEGRRWAG